MTRAEILEQLQREIASLTDEDIAALSGYGYDRVRVYLCRREVHEARLNVALHNVDPLRSRAQWRRYKESGR